LSEWSEKLDAYLSIHKLSKKQLAQELGISINTLDKWWRNREPSPEHAAKLRQLLNGDAPTTTTVPVEDSASPVKETASSEVAVKPPTIGSTDHGKRYEEKSAVISLLRTTCPFCKKAIDRFRHCTHCGQHFVWANVPMDNSS